MSEPSSTGQSSKEQKSIIPLGARGIHLSTFDELYRFSQFVVDAQLAPRSIDTVKKVFLAIQYSMEMGFPPMTGLQNSMVINNRVCFYGELVVAQVQAHPEFEDMITEYHGEGQDLTCTVTILRKGRTPSVGTFSIRQAQHLINDPAKSSTWGKYAKRMLFWRAFSQSKTIFSDALKGIVMPSDLEDIETPKPANVITVTKPTFTNTNEQTEEKTAGNDSQPEAPPEDRESGTQEDLGDSDTGSVPEDNPPSDAVVEPKPKVSKSPALEKADRLLRMINKEGWHSTEIVDLLEAFGADIGAAKKSGLIHDLPAATLNQALAQWETLKFNAAKKLQCGEKT